MNIPFAIVAMAVSGLLPQQYAAVDVTCRVFTHAQYQNNCGACAAFAVTTLLSMRLCLYGDEKDTVLSPYRLFDCTLNASCNRGATIPNTLRALRRSPLGDVRDSPQTFGLTCPWHGSEERIFVWRNDPLLAGLDGVPWLIRAALWLYGPLLAEMVGFVERAKGERVYRVETGRVFPTHGTHAIVLVGWDAEGNWLVQNSWGEHWGDAHGRGWIAPNVLVDAFDPSIMHSTYACLGFVLFVMSAYLCAWLQEQVTAARRAPQPLSRGLSTIQQSSDLAVRESPMKTSSTASSSASSAWLSYDGAPFASISASSSGP